MILRGERYVLRGAVNQREPRNASTVVSTSGCVVFFVCLFVYMASLSLILDDEGKLFSGMKMMRNTVL